MNSTVLPDIKVDERLLKAHRLDSLNILLYTFLLSLTVITIWVFKFRRSRYLHETGLAIIYGLIVGAILNYTGEDLSLSHMRVTPESGIVITDGIPPDTLWMRLNTTNTTESHNFVYSLRGELKKEENEIVMKATFDPEIFFNILLPPIIFNAGYALKRKHFFRNLGAIFTFAFIGTTMSAFVVGGFVYSVMFLIDKTIFTFIDCLLFGALISATDPVTVLAIFSDLNVDVNLYALVFGESVLNDAVAIVLSSAIEQYGGDEGNFEVYAVIFAFGNFIKIFSLSFIIGSVMGCLTAVLTKFTRLRDFPQLETALFVLMSYSTFLMAEAAQLTGIVSVLFCGICQAHYTFNNLSLESRLSTKNIFELLTFLSENFIFSYIGVSMFTFEHHKWVWSFIFVAFLAIMLGRMVNIYPLSFIINIGRKPKIPSNFMHLLYFVGLRGAIAFALAIRNTTNDARRALLTTTSLIVIVTVIFCGGFTTQVLSWLGIPIEVEEEETQHLNTFTPMSNGSASVDGPVDGNSEQAWMFRAWSQFDFYYMKPFLTNSRPTLMDTMPSCCAAMARALTTTEQLTQDRHPLNDEIAMDNDALSSVLTRTTSPRQKASSTVCEGDLGEGSDSLVQTRVAMSGVSGHKL